MKRINSRSLTALAVTAVTALGVAAAHAPQVEAQPAPVSLKIATIPSDIAAEVYYAKDQGFFKAAGLEVSITPITNGGAISSAVASNAVDIGYSNVVSIALAHARGLPFSILAPANIHTSSAPTAGIIDVAGSSPIHSAKDLNGKTFAVTGLGNIANIAAAEWIDQDGGDAKTVRFVEIPLPQLADAVRAGKVAAASLDAIGDPTQPKGKEAGGVRRLGVAFDAVGKNFVPSVWFSTIDWIEKHPREAKSFVAVMKRTAAWANTHHRESAAILARYTKYSPAEIQSVTRATYGATIRPEMIQGVLDSSAKYGALKATFPAKDLISAVAE